MRQIFIEGARAGVNPPYTYRFFYLAPILSPVMLSAAKNPRPVMCGFFAALSMTGERDLSLLTSIGIWGNGATLAPHTLQTWLRFLNPVPVLFYHILFL